MEKSWKKTVEGIYAFYAEGAVKGSLALQSNSSCGKAKAFIAEDVYEIVAKGFWKSEVVITDFAGNVILSVKPAKWYGSTYDVLHGAKVLRLEIRNNPLAEWVLRDGSEILCSYGLDMTHGNTALKIGGKDDAPLIYDFLLWYLFLPIATEQSGDTFVFNMLVSAQ